MSHDLNDLIENWPHELGQNNVRTIVGRDGKVKVQVRPTFGLIQMEIAGRPDGLMPNGAESLLAWHMERAEQAALRGETYTITPEECGELQAEGMQYYHRYLSFFQLDNFAAVIRDTQRNLDLIEFVHAHADRPESAMAFEPFFPYVTMMNGRAKAAMAMNDGRIDVALKEIDITSETIKDFLRSRGFDREGLDRNNELLFLRRWREEVKARRRLTKTERLQAEMDKAIAIENYERAAELRDEMEKVKLQEVSVSHPPSREDSMDSSTPKKVKSAKGKPKNKV